MNILTQPPNTFNTILLNWYVFFIQTSGITQFNMSPDYICPSFLIVYLISFHSTWVWMVLVGFLFVYLFCWLVGWLVWFGFFGNGVGRVFFFHTSIVSLETLLHILSDSATQSFWNYNKINKFLWRCKSLCRWRLGALIQHNCVLY